MAIQISILKHQAAQMLMRLINWQTIRFIITGAAGALLYFVCSYVLISQFRWPAYLASLSAYATSFGFTYLGQKLWAFRSTAPHSRTVTRYALLQGGCAGFTALFTQLAADHTPLSTLAISFIATFVAAGVSYFASSCWVFVEESEHELASNTSSPDRGDCSVKERNANILGERILKYFKPQRREVPILGVAAQALLLLGWLVAGGLYVKSYAYTPYIQDWHWLRDDQLFITLAYLFNQNHWQGPFCDLILYKGLSYSLVVAALQFTKLPLYLMTGISHYFSISALSWSLWRLSRSSWLCLVLWVILLGAPFYASNNVLFCEQLYPDQFMLGIALSLHALFMIKSQSGALLTGGLSSWIFGAFWRNHVAGHWVGMGLSGLILIALVYAWSIPQTKSRIFQVIALMFFGSLSFQWFFEFLRVQ